MRHNNGAFGSRVADVPVGKLTLVSFLIKKDSEKCEQEQDNNGEQQNGNYNLCFLRHFQFFNCEKFVFYNYYIKDNFPFSMYITMTLVF